MTANKVLHDFKRKHFPSMKYLFLPTVLREMLRFLVFSVRTMKITGYFAAPVQPEENITPVIRKALI